MKKVLITNTYFYPLDTKQWQFKQPYPPLGTLWAAAVLREHGFDVVFHDNNFNQQPRDICGVIRKERPDYFVIYDDGFNYLTKMCLTVMRHAAMAMAEEAKRAACTVIISSSDATDHSDEYLASNIDYVIRGEGEITLRQLLTKLDDGSDIVGIEGIAFTRGGKTFTSPPRPVLRDLDELPLPAWDMLDINPYRDTWIRHHGYFSINIATTRGCPFKCNWCAKPIYGNRYHSRSPQQVTEEIAMLISMFAPDHFWMCDDIFGLKPGWVKKFDELCHQKKISIRYKIQSRADLLLEPDTLRALASSGADTVWMGAESGSQKILDAMDKGTTIEQIELATTSLKSHGIRPSFFLQFGYPGESWADINATLNLVLKLMPDEIGISVSYPLPGTKFFENVKASMQHTKQNWTDSDDLAMMFPGTYHPAFYKILHRYIHSRYRIKRGLTKMRRPLPVRLRNFASMLWHLPLSIFQVIRLKQYV